MNNNKRLEIILKIRNIRDKFNLLSLTNEEKEVLKQALNLYEEDLDVEIARMNKEITVLEEEGIESFNDKVNVPIDTTNSRYLTYANVVNIDIIKIIEKVLEEIKLQKELTNDEQEIILKSLKDYCVFLQYLEKTKNNNQELYGEEFQESLKK